MPMETSITKADVRDARECLAKMKDAEELITLMRACTLDCDEEDERCRNLKGFLTQFLEIFGAKFPTR